MVPLSGFANSIVYFWSGVVLRFVDKDGSTFDSSVQETTNNNTMEIGFQTHSNTTESLSFGSSEDLEGKSFWSEVTSPKSVDEDKSERSLRGSDVGKRADTVVEIEEFSNAYRGPVEKNDYILSESDGKIVMLEQVRGVRI